MKAIVYLPFQAATLLASLLITITDSFVVVAPHSNFLKSPIEIIKTPTVTIGRPTTLLREGSSDSEDDDGGLSPPEQTVYDVLQDMHDSDRPFRLVVVGNGAILETTSQLGPTFKLGKSPRTGEPLTTFASEDQSFEFHLMISQVSKIVLTEKTTDEKIMQIFRFLTSEGKPMCSLILADKSEEAQKWFGSILEKYNGGDIQL